VVEEVRAGFPNDDDVRMRWRLANRSACLEHALKNGNIRLLRGMDVRREEVVSVDGLSIACGYIKGEDRAMRMVKYLVDAFDLTLEEIRSDCDKAFRFACFSGNLEVMKYLRRRIGCLVVEDVVSSGGENACSAILQACRGVTSKR